MRITVLVGRQRDYGTIQVCVGNNARYYATTITQPLSGMMHIRYKVPTSDDETRLWSRGFYYVAGIDEAGRGPWAGPVYAAAVILPHSLTCRTELAAVRDSKTLSPLRRNVLDKVIRETAIAVGVGRVAVEEIDALGIVPSTRLAMHRALETLAVPPHALIIDALTLPESLLPQMSFPYADSRSLAVACAGIVAKVARDTWMVDVAEVLYPGYGFAQHKGYGTRMHQEALDHLGVCAIHRRSFRPIAARV